MIVVLLGAPGCGKGTQAAFLVNEKGFIHISTGDLLRKEIDNNTELGESIQQKLESGSLVPDEIVFLVIKKNLDFSLYPRLLLDGFPRTRDQAILLDAVLGDLNLEISYVFDFYIDEDHLHRRIAGRFSCVKCGAIYHDDYRLPKVIGQCDHCDSKEFKRRSDDRADVLSKRLVEFNKLTMPLNQYYVERNKLHKIDAAASVEQMKKNIFSFIEQ
jgi:adenylate kinase